MGKVENTIKAEITRLAKKEVKAVSRPLAREVRELRLRLSNLVKSVSVLDRWAREQIESGAVPNPRGRVPNLDG